MARHPGSVEIDRAISEKEAMEILQPAERVVAKSVPATAPVAVAPEGEQPAPAKNRLRRMLLTSGGLLVLGAGAYFGWNYWTVGRFEVSTDDAYVQAENKKPTESTSGALAKASPMVKLMAEEFSRTQRIPKLAEFFTYLRYEGAWCLYSDGRLTKIS